MTPWGHTGEWMYDGGHSEPNEGQHEGTLGSGGMTVGILNLMKNTMRAYWGVEL